MKLSICYITMNRAPQLSEAIQSCLDCNLPDETEFVIIDNASTDNTEEVVHSLLSNCGYQYYYEKLSENIGAGGGRNYAYDKAHGEYVYLPDDDAAIASESMPHFFTYAINVLEKYPNAVSLTTQIYDTVLKINRVDLRGSMISEGVYKGLMFSGGSHFLRRSFYKKSPYLPNKYGYEELPPSLNALAAGKLNLVCPDLLAIHTPPENKWDWDDEKNYDLLIKSIALPYAIKKMMYPKIVHPLLKLAAARRMRKYASNVPNVRKRAKQTVKEFCKKYPIKEKVSFTAVCRIFKDFKLGTF